MKTNRFTERLFDVETNTNVTSDFAPVISIDVTSRLAENINKLRAVLGVSEMKAMPKGSTVKVYKNTVTKAADQVGEGEVIGLSKVTRTVAKTITLDLKKYRRLTTAEAIQQSGSAIAVNEADEKLIGAIRKDIKGSFFTNIAGGTGASASGGGSLQAALANVWGDLQVKYEDVDVTPVFFVNPVDVATYLGSATITTQTAFGFSYVENFLGLGTAILSGDVTRGTVYGTVAENLNGVYVPASGDLGTVFGLTFDASGMVGMTHSLATDRASLETLIFAGVVFYAEDLAGIYKSEITE